MTASGPAPTTTAIASLLDRYRGLLIDAYGVLVDAGGPLPGAAALITELDRRGTPYLIVTNDASRLPATIAARFAGFGLPIPPERIACAGELVAGALQPDQRVCVLGPRDSFTYVERAGARAIAPAAGIEIDAIAVCDEDGFDFLPGCEQALAAAVRALDAGRPLALVLANPDLLYPRPGGELGFTAGAIALLIEAALARRYPALAPRFLRLGKPERHLFDRAVERLGLARGDVVVIGDQLETDVAGATAAGLDSALLRGLSRWTPGHGVTPTYLLDALT